MMDGYVASNNGNVGELEWDRDKLETIQASNSSIIVVQGIFYIIPYTWGEFLREQNEYPNQTKR